MGNDTGPRGDSESSLTIQACSNHHSVYLPLSSPLDPPPSLASVSPVHEEDQEDDRGDEENEDEDDEAFLQLECGAAMAPLP